MKFATLQLCVTLGLCGCVHKTYVVRPIKKVTITHSSSHTANERISELSNQIKKGNQ